MQTIRYVKGQSKMMCVMGIALACVQLASCSDMSSFYDGVLYGNETTMGIVADPQYKLTYDATGWQINSKTHNVNGDIIAYTADGKTPDVSLQAFKYQYIRNRSTTQTCSTDMTRMKEVMTDECDSTVKVIEQTTKGYVMSSRGICHPKSMIAGDLFNVKNDIDTVTYRRCFQESDGIYTLVYFGKASKANESMIKRTFLHANIQPTT